MNVFRFTEEQLRRMQWRNLSPVVETVTQETGHARVTIARHADGRFTLLEDALPAEV